MKAKRYIEEQIITVVKEGEAGAANRLSDKWGYKDIGRGVVVCK